MFSNTYLPVIRQPAKRIATGALAALILAAFAQTSSASDTARRVGPEPHWSSRIGTAQASPGRDVRKLAERKRPAEVRAIAEPLGDHPAVLVAQSWSSRGIDPNTFIVLHPAGPIWVNTSPTATENATSDTAARAVSTASASNK